MPADKDFDPDSARFDNLEFETKKDILVQDIRGLGEGFRIAESGFEVLDHVSQVLGLKSVDQIHSAEPIELYKAETEELLKSHLGACFVKCYDLVLRKNISFDRSELDIRDPLHIEGPARGAHNGDELSNFTYFE